MIESETKSRQSHQSLKSAQQMLQRPASSGSIGNRRSSRPQTAQHRQSIADQDEHLPDINLSQRSKQQSASALKKMSEGPVRADPFLSYATVEARDQLKRHSQNQLTSQNGASTPSQGRLRSRRESLQQRSLDVQRQQDFKQASSKKPTLETQDLIRMPNDDIKSQITNEEKPYAMKLTNVLVADKSFDKSAEFQNQNLRQLQTKIDANELPTPEPQKNDLLKKTISTNKSEEQKVAPPKQQIPEKTASLKKQKNSLVSAQQPVQVQNKNKTPKKKVTEAATINRFSGLTDKEVLDFLTGFCATKIAFSTPENLQPPADLDSTDSIDSFIMALLQINTDGITSMESDDLESLHLAAGTRNSFCRQMLQGLINYQNKESVFSDALGFFQESMVKLLNVTSQNEQRREQIEILEKVKEELTMKMFDYQKKLTDTSTSLLKLRQTEFEQSKLLAATKKQLEHKKAECESLNYMIKNNVTSTEVRASAELNIESDVHVPEVDTDYILSPHTQHQDVQLPTQAFVENTNLVYYQEQIQKLSIENRQQQERISQMQISFESKDRLIQHLENSISQMLVEKEHNVIKLKSEIVLLQNKQAESENTYKNKLIQMRQRVEADEKVKVQQTVEGLKNEIEVHLRKGEDQASKIQRLQADYKQLSEEFQNYRKEKATQEANSEVYLKDLETKYKSVSEQFTEYNQVMSNKLDMFDSQSLQKQHENEALYLRLKYLKQSAETLVRQKNFLMETIEKSREELKHQMEVLEEAMTSQNKSKSYLISVEKATKQTRTMSELGENALSNIENIIKFLKVEKMYELVFQAEPPVQPSAHSTIDKDPANTIAPKTEHHIKGENTIDAQNKVILPGADQKVGAVQDMLDKLKTTLDVPVQFKAKIVPILDRQPEKQKGGKTVAPIVKNEEYYLEHCPIELCSILLKFIIQQLVTVEAVSSVEQIPFSISRLIFLANSKSDLTVERELFDQYLFESKKIIDDEYRNMIDQIQTHDKLKSILPPNAGRTVHMQQDTNQSFDLPKSPRRASYNILSMQAFENKDPKKIPQITKEKKKDDENRTSNQGQVDDLEKENLLLQTENQKLKMMLTDQKKKSKELQMSLAGEIVVLQEEIESQAHTHQKLLDDRDELARQELEKFKQGCQQREKQLLAHLHKIQDRNSELEIKNSQNNRQSALSIKAKEYMNEGVMLSGSHQSHNEILRSKKSLHSIIHEVEKETSAVVKQIQNEFETFKQNVSSYIDVRESTRSSVSLVFEVNEQTQQLINESILTLYMSKLYQLPKEKIKVLSSTNFSKEVNQDSRELRKQVEQIAFTKVLIEIVQETDKLEKQQADIQAAINDGSSLLFDISPSYMCFNLGNCGLATKNKLQNCHMLAKTGLMLQGQEFIVTILRHNVLPDVFMIVAINMKIGQEFVLELNQKDTLTLINGEVSLLETDDCPKVQELILANLALVQISQEKSLYLTCEYRLHFNEVWQSKFVSKAATGSLQNSTLADNKNVRKYDVAIKERGLTKSIYALSTVRDTFVKQPIPDQLFKTQLNYEAKLKMETEQQTDFKTSLMYEANIPIFQTSQKISDSVELNISIEESNLSKTIQVKFQDMNSQATLQFSIHNNRNQASTRIQLNRDSAEDIQNTQNEQDAQSEEDLYFIQSQIMMIGENHLVLISIERQINSGILIKMHDIKHQTSGQISLAKKSNGKMARTMQSNQLQLSEQFRQLVLNLSFNQIEEQQEILQHYLVRAEEKMLSQGQDPQLTDLALIGEAVVTKPHELEIRQPKTFVTEALRAQGNPYARHTNNTDTFKQLKERGKLIFRDCIHIRVGSNIRISDEDISDDEQAQDFKITSSLISLYFKEQSVTIEIFLYQSHKISITSSVPVQQLFVGSPLDLSASSRAAYIQSMLEKLFVVEIEGKFQMKVDSEAEAISVLISRQKERELLEAQERERGATKPRRQAPKTEESIHSH